jgi:hypothetical protein
MMIERNLVRQRGAGMTQPTNVHFDSTPSVEDVMAALAKAGIFDLPALGRAVIEQVQKEAEAENDPPVLNIFVSDMFLYAHGTQGNATQ